MKHFIIVALILILMSALYKTNEHFTSKNTNVISNSDSQDEVLIYNGSVYELWRYGKVELIFSTFTDYVNYFNFSFRKNQNLKPLKPILKSRWTPGGSMIDTRFVDSRYFNIEHFENAPNSNIKEEMGSLFSNYIKTNPDCDKMKFQDSLLNYVAIEYYKLNKRMLSAPLLTEMKSDEQTFFINLFKNLSMNCNEFLNKYSKYDFRGKSDDDLKKYFEVAIKETASNTPTPSGSNTSTSQLSKTVPELSETPEDKKKKDLLIRDSQQIILNYLDKNPVCKTKLASKDEKFYILFQTSFSNFMKTEFLKRLGYIPNKNSIDSMNLNEANTFISIYRDLPDCDTLVNKYSNFDPEKNNSNTIKVQPDTTESISKKPNSVNEMSYVQDDSIGFFMKEIGKSLNDIAFKLDQHMLDSQEKNKPAVQSVSQLDKETTKYLDAEIKLKADLAKKNVTPSNNTVVPIKDITAKDIKNPSNDAIKKEKKQLMNEAPDFIKKGKSINDNFAYKPEYNNCQLQPSKEIYGAYGWSYMPPQSWSVPQKRPPVCIPAQGKQSTVTAIYDKSVPTDVLEWTQVGSILPKFEYKEVYNPDYYHPGWIAGQEDIKYPFNQQHFKSEYYGLNLAEPTMKQMSS